MKQLLRLLGLLVILTEPVFAEVTGTPPAFSFTSPKMDYVADANGTPVAKVDSNGLTLQQPGHGIVKVVYVPTMAATPVVGTNMIVAGALSVVPTAAANTAAIIGPPTPVPGQIFKVFNSGPNSIRIKAGGGATMNGATAGGYLVVATLLTAECETTSATNYACSLSVNPTPAGP